MYFVKEQHSIGKYNGVNKVAAQILADTADDLPEYNDCSGVDGELSLGTFALTADGKLFSINSSGTWIEQGV